MLVPLHLNPQAARKYNPDAMFSDWAKRSTTTDDGLRQVTLEFLSYLLANYARPKTGDLLMLSLFARQTSDKCFTTCCLRAVSTAANPFITGMELSVALSDAAENAPEGERRDLLSLKTKVDTLLLEIFERLPQTVGGIDGDMGGCSDIFEPEGMGSTGKGPGTPRSLSLALQRRQQIETYCKVPLVMDFLSRIFSRGLPDVRDTGSVLSDQDELRDLLRGSNGVDLGVGLSDHETIDERICLTHGSQRPTVRVFEHTTLLGRNSIFPSLISPGALLQGSNHRFPSLTFLPGAQFVSAGLVAKPGNYYKVPAMRMALDFVVYLFLLAVFSMVVVFHDNGALHWGEYVLMAYIVVSVRNECMYPSSV